MKGRKLSQQVVWAIVITLLFVGCGAPVATPTPIPPTATPMAPTATLVPSTQSPEPPTATPMAPTATLVPPTQSSEPPTTTLATMPSDKGKLEKGQITSQALANNLIGDPATRDFWIYLPPSYNTSDKLYPVVYALHGFTGDENSLKPMSREMDKLAASGEAHEMIIVFVDGDNKFRGSLYLSSPTIGDYESYIVRELVAHIDANYRTLPDRDSRGITGCSMGGEGALRLALKYPEVFSVAAAMSGVYDYEHDPLWDKAKEAFRWTPEDFNDFARLPFLTQWFIAAAATVASNPDKPPFYLDMPFEIIDGKGQIVPDVWKKVNAVDPLHYVHHYLNQPVRLRGLMIYHGEYDPVFPVDVVRDFDKMLTELGVEHEYVEDIRGHCNLKFTPVLQFMSDHLAF